MADEHVVTGDKIADATITTTLPTFRTTMGTDVEAVLRTMDEAARSALVSKDPEEIRATLAGLARGCWSLAQEIEASKRGEMLPGPTRRPWGGDARSFSARRDYLRRAGPSVAD